MRCVVELRLITLSFASRGERTKDGMLVSVSLPMPEARLLSCDCSRNQEATVSWSIKLPVPRSLFELVFFVIFVGFVHQICTRKLNIKFVREPMLGIQLFQ